MTQSAPAVSKNRDQDGDVRSNCGDAMTRHGPNPFTLWPRVQRTGSRTSRTGTRRNVAFVGAIGAAVLSVALASCGGGPSVNGRQSGSIVSELDRAVHEEVIGNDARAVVDFLAVVKADPRNHIAWYNLGVIADRNGQASQAVTDYRSALVGDAHYVPALYNLAELEAPAHAPEASALPGGRPTPAQDGGGLPEPGARSGVPGAAGSRQARSLRRSSSTPRSYRECLPEPGRMRPAGAHTTVGLAMIVKNEARTLPAWPSLDGQLDHWTIVDTGSTDGTPTRPRSSTG